METEPNASNNAKDGCSTCQITSFAGEQDLFEHKFSLIHHTNLDKEYSSTWYHLCELCWVKAGNLSNYADHLQGKRHKRNLLMHRQKISRTKLKEQRAKRAELVQAKVLARQDKKAKGSSSDDKTSGQNKSKKNSQANSETTIQSKAKPSCKTKAKANSDSTVHASDQTKDKASRQSRVKAIGRTKAKSSDQTRAKVSSKTKAKPTKETDTRAGGEKKIKKWKSQLPEVSEEEKVSDLVGQEVASSEAASELPLKEAEMLVSSTAGGAKEASPKAAPVSSGSGNSLSEPSASQVRPDVSKEGRFPTNGWAMNNSHWHRPPPPNYRHLPGAWGAPPPAPPGNYPRVGRNGCGYGWLPGSHGYGPPPPYGAAPHIGMRFRYPPSTIHGHGGYFQSYDRNMSQSWGRSRERASKREPCNGEQQNPNRSRSSSSGTPNGSPTETLPSSVQVSSFTEDVPLAATTGWLSESSPPAKEKVSSTVQKQPDTPATKTVGDTSQKAKTPPSTLARASVPTVSVSGKAPSGTTDKAAIEAAQKAALDALAAVRAKNVKKEIQSENTMKKIQPVPEPVRSHQIFVSSSEEETEESESTRPSDTTSKGSTSEGRAKKAVAKTAAKTVAKPRLPATPERGLPKELPGKSPRPTSTKDAYRKDVLDKLVNFPSSRKVQTQLSKWMRDLQKSSSSTGPPGKTQSRLDLKLCSTRSLVARAEEGAIADFDYGSLMQQVDVGELPEEMLKSLMNALSSDGVVSDDTLSFASEDDECIIVPPPPKVVLSVDSESDSPEEGDRSGQHTKKSSLGGNAVSDKDTAATPEKTETDEPHHTKQVRKKERTSEHENTAAASDDVINMEENNTTRAEEEPDTARPMATCQKESDAEKQDGTASEDNTQAIQMPKKVPQAKTDASRESGVRQTRKSVRRKGGEAEKADATAEASSTPADASVPTGSQTQGLLLPGSTTPIPVAPSFPTPVQSLGPSSASEQTPLLKQTPPPPSTSSPKPSTAPSPAAPWSSPQLVGAKPEPGVVGGVPVHGGVVTPPLRALVNELVQLCHEEDHLRTQMSLVEQKIIAVTLSLEDLRKKKDELVFSETQVRQKRLEKLQCLQGATSLPMGFNFPINVSFPSTSEVLTSLVGGGLDHFSFGVPTSTTTTTPPTAGTNQSGNTSGGLSSSAPDIIQHLLDNVRNSSSPQFGNLGESTLSSMEASGMSAPSSTPPVSSSTSAGPAKKAVAKRKTTTGTMSPATRKRPRTSKSDAEIDIEESRLNEIVSGQEIAAHEGAIVALKLHKHYVFSTSTDNTAKRHDLLDPSKCVVYQGSTKTVNSLEVQSGKRLPTLLYTTSLDCFLRCYDMETGECLHEHNMETPIICSVLCWGKIYLGLQTGYVAVFNLKSLKVQDTFSCSNMSVSRMAATTEGAQKLLCTVTYDGSITVRDPSTGLLFRCLDGLVQPPSCIAINNGCVYTTSTNRTVHVHELRTGILLKVFEVKSVATGVRFYKNLLLCCSFDGLICCYKVKDFSCQVLYYGAGKNMVMSMDACGPLIVTGNRKGKIEVIKLDVKSKLHTCEIRSCHLKFAREEDLVHHLKRDHIGVSGVKGSRTCPWTQCQMTFSGPNCNKDFEKHLMDHAYT